MQKATYFVLFSLAIAGFASLGCESNSEISFNEDIRPILNENCVACHGGIRRQSDLNLLWREDALLPAESGHPAIVPFEPSGSELIRRISSHDADARMPKDADPLSDEAIQRLRKWISEGAPWDAHWAYKAPVEPKLPAVTLDSWPKVPLDYLVLARLEKEGLTPSDPAPCPTLVRRASLDLIGLPPSPDVVEEACGPLGFEAYVDSLLASPHFGERWAAMWLDLARYADSKGYEKDIPRTIWRYRDWVIKAFNEDMPFDQFTIEQIAGDLLPDATNEQRIATAFHRNTMTNTEGGTDDEEFRVAAVIDRVNTTWAVWQGTSMSCAQCHGHPYDPFRHEDYFRVFAFFNNTADRDASDEYPTLFEFAASDSARGHRLLKELDQLEVRIAAAATADSIRLARQEWETMLSNPAEIAKVDGMQQGAVRRIAQLPESERDGAQRTFINRVFAEISTDQHLDSLRAVRSAKRQELHELEAVQTPVLQEVPPGERRTTHLFERGSFLSPLQQVNASIPGSLPPLPSDAPPDRLGLARWLVAADNPLTARVTVNRFWEQIFGTGIVESLEDFGTQGLPPSHPQLLDYLAVRFSATQEWSIKSMLREVVTSATYQQDSRVSPALHERDPYNRLLARGPRFRLSAEQIRDQALFVSGLLSTKMYGPSVMPPQPEGLWQNPYDGSSWQSAENEDRYRRGIYTYWRRTVPYPSMATFDSPSREFCVSRRIRTNTPLQALVTLNDPAFIEAARSLANRMYASGSTPESQIDGGYRMALAVAPSAETMQELLTLYNEGLVHYASNPADMDELGTETIEAAALTVAANAILNLDRFLMKE